MSGNSRNKLTTGERGVFWFLTLLNLVPIWAFHFFPGQDTPNHLYTVETLRAILDGGAPPALSQAFVATLSLKSNTLFHFVMLGLCRLGISIELGHRLVLSLYALTLPLAGLFCLRAANRRNAVLALLLVPLVWNWFVVQGLYNFAFSLVPALVWIGIVARDDGDHRTALPSTLALGAAAVIVYVAHAGTFVALAFVTTLRILRPADGSRLGPFARLRAALPWLLALVPAGLLAITSLHRLASQQVAAEPTVSALEFYGPLDAAGSFFVEFVMRYHLRDLIILGPVLLVLMAIPLGASRARNKSLGDHAEGQRVARWPLHAALLLTILYFALPHIVMGSDLSPRLRPAIVFCLLCFTGISLSDRRRRVITMLAFVAGTTGVVSLCVDFSRFNRQLRDFTSGIPFVREGSRVYPMVFDERGSSLLVRPFLHAWGYYGVYRHAVSPFAFAWHESRFPYRYRNLPLHGSPSRLPSDGEDEPYALTEDRLCPAIRRFAPSLDCATIRADAESRLANLGKSYDYVLTWAAPADFSDLLAARGYRRTHGQGNLALYQPPLGGTSANP